MHTSNWLPPADLYETEENIIVRVEIAGMHDEDFSIELNRGRLRIQGVRQELPERRAYHQMEIQFGEFSLQFTLPSPVDSQNVEATYENGFLHIIMQKAHARHIPIET